MKLLAAYTLAVSLGYALVSFVAAGVASSLTVLFVALLLLPHHRWGRP